MPSPLYRIQRDVIHGPSNQAMTTQSIRHGCASATFFTFGDHDIVRSASFTLTGLDDDRMPGLSLHFARIHDKDAL